MLFLLESICLLRSIKPLRFGNPFLMQENYFSTRRVPSIILLLKGE